MSENVTNGDGSGSKSTEVPVEVDGSGESEQVTGEVINEDGIAIEVEAGTEVADPVAELEAKVAELEAKAKENWDRFLRASADLENYRKRAKRDVDEARLDAQTRVLKEMLPVMDNLERALQHTDEASGEAAQILDGVKLVMRQFSQALARFEVAAVEALGKPFDPNLHEAIQQIPTADYDPGCVAAVVQTGYTIGDRLLRPAMVVVATAPPEAEKPPGGNGHDDSGVFETGEPSGGGGSAPGEEE